VTEYSNSKPIADIWPCLMQPDLAGRPDNADAFQAAISRLAKLVSPLLADYLLAPLAARMGRQLVDPQAVANNRIAARFALAQQRKWVIFLASSGIEVAFIKGFANAHLYYPDPVLRMQGDLDILVRKPDLSPLIELLAHEGFSFRSAPLKRWGLISDASFMPFVSGDGACNIDIHIQPDCYPAHRSLSVDRLFRKAGRIAIDNISVAVPSPEHVLILCVTNAAKDKFDLLCLRKMIDAIVALRSGPTVDWDEIVGIARDGGFLLPMRVFFAILIALGMKSDCLPPVLRAPLTRLRRGALDRVVEQVRLLFPVAPPLATLFWREAVLCAEPPVALHNCLLRARGLIRPARGIPEGAPVEGQLTHP
jgi:hypothetical protein